MRYIPYHLLNERPSVVVDGRRLPGTVLTLSHWPRSGTPEPLKADLSTEIVFRYLDRPEFHVDVEAATNTHFDEDGLASLFAITRPTEALERRDQVISFARAGDFGTFSDRRAAHAALATSAFADPQRSPLGTSFFACDDDTRTANLYEEMLGRLPELLDNPDQYRELWAEEASFVESTEARLQTGEITLEEFPELDLAVVTLPESATMTRVHRFAQIRHYACHPMAIYNATSCARVLYVCGRRYELEFRYESWVELTSRRPALRVDLQPFAERLTTQEPRGVVWGFDGASELTPRLKLTEGEQSGLAVGDLLEQLRSYLVDAPPAWNPYEGEQP